MSQEAEAIVAQVEALVSTTSTEVLTYDVFRADFSPVADSAHELREKLKSIAKASSRLHAIKLEYLKLQYPIRRQFILSEEGLQSARGIAMINLPAEVRKGLSREERQALADQNIPGELVQTFRSWRTASETIDDAVRMVDARLKEVAFSQKSVHDQLEALRQEIRMQGYQGSSAGPHRFDGQ